jgi:hypothetical protein
MAKKVHKSKAKKAKPDYLDMDKDGNKKEPMKQAVKSAKKKATKKPTKKAKKVSVNESKHITQFIGAVSDKKYALAHKYLRAVINEKIKARIASSLNDPLF